MNHEMDHIFERFHSATSNFWMQIFLYSILMISSLFGLRFFTKKEEKEIMFLCF